jgi:neurotransmitter:Na+ symporter, NSS family
VAEIRVRDRWGSRIGVILAVAGSAVGLGNFLRFPGNAAQNGGGAFMLPYFISLLVLGLPMCWAEWTMGRYAGVRGFNSAPAIYTTIWRNRISKYFGSLAILIPLVIYMYYVLIEAWCLGYAINYLTGALMLGSDASEYGKFFGDFVGIESDGALLTEGNRSLLVLLTIVFACNFVLIYRGVNKGIETFCKIAMPVLIVLGLIVLIRVLTLGTPDPNKPDQSVLGGLGFMWNPHPDKLFDFQTWLAASGQVFFSLSVGFGIIVNYASYLSRDDDLALSGLTSSSMNEFFEVCLGGLITVPAAFIFLGLAAGDFTGSSFALGFQALPNVFAMMPAGQFFGFLWFFMLFMAAITSSVSMLQPVIAFLEEGFGLKRHASAAVLGLLSAIGCGFVLYFSKNLVALDMMDFWVGSVALFVLAMIQSFLYAWMFGIKRGHEELHRGAHIRIPWAVQLVMKYVVPVYLLVIFVGFCYQKLPSSDRLEFEAPLAQADTLSDGALPEWLQSEFAEQELVLPEDAVLRAGAHRAVDGGWRIVNEQQHLLYRLVPEDGQWAVNSRQVGYVESISRNGVALLSMLFISVLFVFVLVLVHIAGRRWEAAGRFDNLPN